MPQIAKVVAEIALDKEFDYLIPEDVRATAAIGSRVRIPFGHKHTTGYIVDIADHSDRPGLKSILAVMDSAPMLSDRLLELARWIGDYYAAPIEQVLKTMLPGAVRRPGARAKSQLHVYPVAEIATDATTASLPPKQRQSWALIQERGEISLQQLIRELGITAAPVRSLEKRGFVRIVDAAMRRAPVGLRTILPTQALSLNAEQAAALDQIQQCIAGTERPRVVLLNGVTGSGKTEVYLQAIEQVCQAGGGGAVRVSS